MLYIEESILWCVLILSFRSEDSSCGDGDGVDLGSECATGETGADRETSEGVDGNVDDGDKETGDGDGSREGGETGVSGDSGGEPADGSDSGACEVLSNTEEDTSTQSIEAPPTSKPSSKVTWQSLEPQWRRFNFDLLPKVSATGTIVYIIVVNVCLRVCVCVCVCVCVFVVLILSWSNGGPDQ